MHAGVGGDSRGGQIGPTRTSAPPPSKLWMCLSFVEETVEAVTLVPRERVKQRTAEQIVREFIDTFTSKEACLGGLHELRTQLEAAGITL